MSVSIAMAQFNDARKAVLARWESCSTQWRDPAAGHFERQFIRAIDQDLHSVVQGLSETQQVIHRARQDCS